MATFASRTGSLYRSMQHRFAAKTNKAGRITRAGREVPFTLAQLRAAILEVYGDQYGHLLCRYCPRPLSVLTFSPDHIKPVKRGGGLGLDNLDLQCCAVCNHRKGGLTREEFQALLAGLKTFPDAAQTDILNRLEIAVQLAAGKNWHANRPPQQQPQE